MLSCSSAPKRVSVLLPPFNGLVNWGFFPCRMTRSPSDKFQDQLAARDKCNATVEPVPWKTEKLVSMDLENLGAAWLVSPKMRRRD